MSNECLRLFINYRLYFSGRGITEIAGLKLKVAIPQSKNTPLQVSLQRPSKLYFLKVEKYYYHDN